MKKCPECGGATVRKTICMRCKRKRDAAYEESRKQRQGERPKQTRSHHNSLLIIAALMAKL